MGPLVPEIIGNELNFVVALFVGIAFGFVLEQAGFSTSKKLVGLFYGYDFTVLRVFFTAGVTAMIGVIAMGHFGMLDLSLIYINPTFLYSALAGGLIMGLGFVIGGFCPGTGVCAAAIGKIDAIIFVVGLFAGVLIFAEGYPLWENLYKAENWGSPRIFELLGISQSLFAFLLMLMAVGAFWAVTFVERKVNKVPDEEFKLKKIYYGLTGIAVVIGLSAFILPDRKDAMMDKLTNVNYISAYEIKTMSADELTFRLMDDDKKLQIFDLRSESEYKELSLPKSTNISLSNIFEKDILKQLSLKGMRNVIIADDETMAKKGAIIASELGYENVKVLKGGMNLLREEILNFTPQNNINGIKISDTERFRIKASKVLPVLISENKLKQSAQPVKKAKRIIGGC
jgi:rhodanese-related sulfurtransferase